ncbi:ribbon-helix-helix protein, CopG family [Bifidobacterium tsurumiense]|nr:ribbon-helix-helix protein, CopG family [Bifidobacterium tsurumiense]
MKKQFNTEIDHETAQRLRDKCKELGVGIGHFIRCIIVPDDAEALHEGDDLGFADIPRPTPVHSGENRNDDRISARMSEAEHEVLTRYAIKGELTRSELMRLLISQALEDPQVDIIVERTDWQVERKCRELLNAIRGRKEIKP